MLLALSMIGALSRVPIIVSPRHDLGSGASGLIGEVNAPLVLDDLFASLSRLSILPVEDGSTIGIALVR
jgi:hypothetical protein